MPFPSESDRHSDIGRRSGRGHPIAPGPRGQTGAAPCGWASQLSSMAVLRVRCLRRCCHEDLADRYGSARSCAITAVPGRASRRSWAMDRANERSLYVKLARACAPPAVVRDGGPDCRPILGDPAVGGAPGEQLAHRLRVDPVAFGERQRLVYRSHGDGQCDVVGYLGYLAGRPGHRGGSRARPSPETLGDSGLAPTPSLPP